MHLHDAEVWGLHKLGLLLLLLLMSMLIMWLAPLPCNCEEHDCNQKQ
jgi:hypothetical protein